MVSIFEINSQKKKGDPKNTYTIQTGGNRVGPQNPFLNQGKTYTQEMKKLDDELISEGVKIERLSDKEKRSYVNSLTDTEYNRLTQYRDAGYSFGASKALVDMEKNYNANGVGGYRGIGYQMSEPLGGQKSAWNLSNPGAVFEWLDDRVQGTLVPKMTVTEREKREEALTKKYNSMTQADRDKLKEEYKNDPKAKNFIDDTEQENLEYYWKQKNRSIRDKLRGADINVTEDASGNRTAQGSNLPSGVEAFANAPASAIANASAVARGVTNPLDNLKMLYDLLGTKEGRDVLANRYLNEQGRNESIEKDPVGWVLDIFDLGALGLNVSAKATRLAGKGSKLVGATNTAGKLEKAGRTLEKASNSMENIADMGISTRYNDKVLDKALGKLSQGGKVSNLLGDYISLTQRPLATIWNGANPRNANGQQLYQNGAWTFKGLQEPWSKVINSAKEKIQTQATGLTPEVRERIRQNPFVREYRDRVEAMINDEGLPMDNQKIMAEPIEEVGQELLRRLEEYESRLQEDGREYQVLDSITRPYNISSFLYKVYDVFAKNGITLTPDGTLNFRTTANPADMNPVNVAWNVIRSMEPNLQNMTIKQIREFRQQLRSLIKYQSDAPSTKYSKKVLREIVDGALNSVVHKEIPSLAKVDEIYTKRLKELREFKDGLVYQVGEKKGQIKDNFYSIISTLNTQNRQKMKARVEKLFPDLGARVEAIRMLPILAKTYQNSPQMMRALFQRAGFLGGIAQSGGVKRAVVGWLLGIVADELFAKPMGEKRRKKAVDDLLNEISPEAMQKLAEIKSKVDAGIELSEQEKQELAVAMQQIAEAEYEYLDEQHKKEFDKIMESVNNQQPKLPAPGMDVINPDGTIKLGTGNPLNSPETYKPKTREERVQEIQQEYEVEPERAEEMTNSIEDFLDEIGGDINGEINPREVDYNRFSTRTLEKLMDDETIPQTEKDKISELLMRRGMESEVDDRGALDQEYAWKINKLTEKEKKIANMKQKNKAQKEQMALEEERDKLKVEMRERYGGTEGLDQNRVEDKYAELESKPIDYINDYKKSKKFKEDQAELKVLDQLKQEWGKQPKFTLKLDDSTASKRQQIIDQPLKNGYERETTSVGDRFINKQTGDKGIVKYGPDGKISVVFTPIGYTESGITDILPGETEIRFEGDSDTIPLSEIRQPLYTDDEIPEFQTVGRANPNERDITAEEGMETRSFRGDKTAQELADDYGLEVKIVDKIFTDAGEEALGRAKGNLIELVKEIKEGTAPHEIFHPIFNMVNAKRRAEIIDLVRKNKGITEAEAKEWLADSFSEYFRTGKFDTKPIPKGFVNKVKWFFNKVKEFLNGTWKNRKKIQKLFDDIMDGKISVQKPQGGRWEYQVKQKSLFDQEKAPYERRLTPEQKEARATKMFRTWDERYGGYRNDVMINYFNNDLDKRMETVKEKTNNDYSKLKYIDYYLTLKAMQNDPDFVEGLSLRSEKITKPGNVIYGSDDLTRLDRLFKNPIGPLKIGDGTEIKISNEKLLEPIRRWLLENDVKLESLRRAYSPDMIQRQNDLSSFDRVPVSELKKLQKYVEELYEKGEEIDKERHRLRSAYPIRGDDPNMALSTIGEGIGETFTDKRIKQVANDMRDNVMDPMGDIFRDAIDGSTTPLTPAGFNEFAGNIYYSLGQTYTPDIKEWSNAIEEEIRILANQKGITLKKKKVIPEAKLQNLGAKLKELLAIGPDVGEYLVSEKDRDYNPNRSEWIRDLVNGAYENSQKQEAKKDIETTKQLVAISNIDFDNFKTQIEKWQGKNPMPSIAITDVNVPHTAFGDISLIFGRETVDPQVDPRNVIFASDARTPMFPNTETAGGIGYTEATELRDILKNKINEVDKLTLAEGGLDPSTVDTLVNKIANELMSNGTDAEYLAGWSDVAENAVENALDDIGLERAENEGLYMDLEKIVADYVKNHQVEERIPGSYFGGRVRYNDPKAVKEVVDKVYNNLTEKGIQKLKDDGWKFDESDNKYVINSAYKDTPPKQGIQRDIDDIIERITDYPNLSVEEGGKEFVNLLIEEYGFDKKKAYEIAESIFGDIGGAKITPDEFRDTMRGERLPDVDNMLGDGANSKAGMIAFDEIQDGVLEKLKEFADDVKDEGKMPSDRMISNLVEDIFETYDGAFAEYNRKRFDEGELSDEEDIMWESTDMMDKFNSTEIEKSVKELASQLIDGVDRSRPLTPENVVEAMRNEGGEGGANRTNAEGTLRDLVGVEGKRFTDIEQVREKNLAKTTHNDRTGDLSAIEKRYNTIVEEIRRDFAEDSGADEGFSVQIVRQEIAWNYDPDLETFRNNLEEENPMWEMVPDDYLQGIIDTVEMGKQVPVRFSESKPERVVDMFKEVKHILAPKEKAREIAYMLRGTPLEGKVHEYNRADFKDSRSRKLKQIQRKYGDIFFSFGGAIMPIAMLLYMMQGEDDQGEGQQA